MPAIIGSLQLNNVEGGVVNFGDALNIAPKSNTKINEGSGSSNTANFIITNNALSATNAFDPDIVDQPSTANN
ncbi:spore germination protein [Bacillus kwashiorkori]|uniref:spore germination protein n=1 Tax=Bacillus kwashiorkori TaxID=1522318 RepID=UPI0007837D93|nr:spore germination protein [Bacillus kwashiorkori]